MSTQAMRQARRDWPQILMMLLALAAALAMAVAAAATALDLLRGAETDGPAPMTMQAYEARMRDCVWPDEMADGHEEYDAGDGSRRRGGAEGEGQP